MESAQKRPSRNKGFSRESEGGEVVSLAERRKKMRRADPQHMRKVRDYLIMRTAREMNRQHAVIQYGSDVLVVTRQHDHKGDVELLYRKDSALKTWYNSRMVRLPKITPGGRISSEEKNPVDIWMYNRNRRSLRGVVNAPGLEVSDEWMNVWESWGTTPRMIPIVGEDGQPVLGQNGKPIMTPDFSGNGCRRILDHIQMVLCGGHPGAYRWVIAWFADIIQNPRHKKPTGLMIYGPQGAGKSILSEQVFPRILGTKAFSLERDTKFLKEEPGNSTAAGKLLIAADEAIFAGDPRAAADLKTFISQETVGVRALYKDKITVDNCARLMATVNPQSAGGHVVAMENDDRRWTVLECSAHRIGDFTYFDALIHEIDNGGVEAFHAYLMNPALLEKIELRKGFETASSVEQKILSLKHQEAFIYECLRSRSVQLAFSEQHREEWNDSISVDQADFYKSYLDWCKAHKRDYPGTIVQFNKKLRTVLGMTDDRTFVGRYNNNGRYWKMADLAAARRQFQNWIRCADEPAYLAKLWGDLEVDEMFSENEPEITPASLPAISDAETEEIPF